MNHPSLLSRCVLQRLSLIAALMLASNSARALVIDDFNSGPLSLHVTNLTGQTVLQSGLPASSVIGGTRSVYMGSVSGSATGQIDVVAGEFSFSTGTNIFGYFKLTYGSTSSPLGINLTSGGNDRFQVRIADLVLGPYSGIFDIYLETGNGWKRYNFSQDVKQLGGSGDLSLPFARFIGSDLTSLRALQIDVGRFSPSSFISIASITTIPEPSGMAIILIGLLGFSQSRGLTRTQ